MLWYSGSTTARNGVGVVLAPYLKDKVVQVSRISDRIMTLFMLFRDSLDDFVRECSTTQQQLIIVGDLNGHIGAEADGFSIVYGGFGYGVRNEEGRTILEFVVAHDLVVLNSFFKNRVAHLITYHSGDHDTQIDHMLVHRGDLRLCKDCKVFPEAAEDFRDRVTEGVTPEVEGRTVADAEQMWNGLVNTIKEAAKEILGVVAGTSRTHICRDESNKSAAEERYKEAKREAKKAVAKAKCKAYEDLYKRLDSKEGENDIYKIAKSR
ncbi:ubiquinol oxidase, mitochondrial-like protein [Tanacetum coccineum]